MGHTYHPADYWMRRHSESVALDIGDDVGALVLYVSPERHGQEIEVSPLGGDARRVHSAVLERTVNGHVLYAAVYPELAAGEYFVCTGKQTRFTIVGGAVAEVQI